MNKTLAIAALTFTLIMGIGAVAYGISQLTINVHVQNVPTGASITITSTNPIDVTLNEGATTTSTITLHNSGETAGTAHLSLVISAGLTATFDNGLTTSDVPVATGATVNVDVNITAPQVTGNTNYTITVNLS